MPLFSRFPRIVIWAVLFLTVLTTFRLAYSTHLELVPDEAYYWLWSKHLDACYRDKGPAIAWTIAAGTTIAGDNVFGVRWLGILLAAGTAWQLFRLARRLFDETTAFWCLLISAIIPLLAIGSIIMTIDSLSVFFWAWGANVAWKTFETNRKRDWVLLGFVIGCGFLSKFTNLLQLASVFLYLLWTPSKRQLIFSRGPILMVAAFLVCCLPMLYWNILHEWPNNRALASRSSIDTGFHLHPGQLGKFLKEQALVISPLLYLGLLAAVLGMAWSRRKEDRVRFLLSDFVPIYACFTFFSVNVAGKGNWTSPALISGIVLLVVFWRAQISRRPLWRIVAGAALFLAFAETAVLHETSWLLLKPKKDPLQRARGWSDLAQKTQKWRDLYAPDFLITNHYSQASILAFYLPDHPTTYTPTSPYIDNQLGMWPGYHAGPDSTALFVTTDLGPDAFPKVLHQEFRHITLLDDFSAEHRGKPVREIKIYWCTNREPAPTAPPH